MDRAVVKKIEDLRLGELLRDSPRLRDLTEALCGVVKQKS
jgi:hypothetical protein